MNHSRFNKICDEAIKHMQDILVNKASVDYATNDDRNAQFKWIGEFVKCEHCGKGIGTRAALRALVGKHLFVFMTSHIKKLEKNKGIDVNGDIANYALIDLTLDEECTKFCLWCGNKLTVDHMYEKFCTSSCSQNYEKSRLEMQAESGDITPKGGGGGKVIWKD